MVGDNAFINVSNPLADVTRTWCTPCNAIFPMSEFAWSDTNEKITDYYARHSAKATSIERFLCSRAFMIVCAITGLALGGIGGYLIMRNEGFFGQLIVIGTTGFLGVFGALAAYLELGSAIARRVCGVKDTRQLK
jgi:hypothetical protein